MLEIAKPSAGQSGFFFACINGDVGFNLLIGKKMSYTPVQDSPLRALQCGYFLMILNAVSRHQMAGV
jgi:hypothetical protein